jgi:putative endonuclease
MPTGTVSSKREAGQQAESIALRYLREQGMKLVERNYHCRYGEIDLLMKSGKTLVFVEVRYRSNTDYGLAEETVTPKKQQKVINAARHYLQQSPRMARLPVRFDVVALTDGPAGSEINWIRDAFQCHE